MCNSFVKFYKAEKSWMAPHPFIILALACQVTAIFMQMLHLYFYAYDGKGSVVLDVVSKVSQSLSESTMVLLFFLLASGWKLRYQDIDYDDNLELHLPMTALVLMVHIIIVALTFVDVDASHKYHDFAGVQGWCLLAVKTFLYLYFIWCYCDSKGLA
mmetsp:Transcript_24566/g.30644  ORF Transcript_24566/g.30644 Transcript_24566/m.30644 type:complete len:157 (+) Transcript_24566:663-1133(+)